MRRRLEGQDRSPRVLVLGAICLSILAGLLALVSTKYGAGIGTDGVVYVAAARNFLAGDGISWVGPQADVRPLVIFAPLLPFVLAVGSFVSGLDAWPVARWLHVLLFGLNVLLLVGYVYWCSRKPWLALLGGIIFTFSRSMILMHTNVRSEPLFLVALTAAVFLLSAYLETEKAALLWASTVMMGLAFLARYAGAYFIAGGAISLMVFKAGDLRDRVKPAAIWVAVNAGVVLGWFARNRLVAGSGTSRQWAPTLPPSQLLQSMAEDISFWFFPEVGPLWIRVAAVVLGLICVFSIRRWVGSHGPGQTQFSRMGRSTKSMGLLALVVVVYIAGLMITRSLVVPRIDIISRTLVPVHVLFLLVIILAASDILDRSAGLNRGDLMRRGVQIVLFGFALTYLLRGMELVFNLQEDGQDYAGQQWHDSPLMNAMNLLSSDTPIYTNQVEAVYLYTGRHPYRLPYGCLPEDILIEQYARANCQELEYLEWVETMREKLLEEQAVIVLFGRTYEQVYDPLIPELLEGLEPLSVQGDGSMYVQDSNDWQENPHW